MKRSIVSVFLTVLAIGAAYAQQPPAPAEAVPIELPLSVQEQAGLRSICVVAMRSPALTESDTLMVGEFCARMRNSIAIANAKPKSPAEQPPQPKE